MMRAGGVESEDLSSALLNVRRTGPSGKTLRLPTSKGDEDPRGQASNKNRSFALLRLQTGAA